MIRQQGQGKVVEDDGKGDPLPSPAPSLVLSWWVVTDVAVFSCWRRPTYIDSGTSLCLASRAAAAAVCLSGGGTAANMYLLLMRERER